MQELCVEIPKNVENLQLPDPSLVDYYKDEEKRIYYIDDEIDETLLDVSKAIVRINREDKEIPVNERIPIKILINSPGGDVTVAWSIIKLIEISKTPVWTINMCGAYSAAANILVAGHKRFSMPGTNTMFHKGSMYLGGEQSIVNSTKKYFDALDKKIEDFLFSKTNINPRMYNKKASSDLYMDEIECLNQGVIDAIIIDLDEIF